MKAFELFRPTSLDEAIELAGEVDDERDAKFLAGGQDLLTELKEHLEEPSRLVDLKGVAGLDGLRPTPDGHEIGALVKVARLARDPDVRALYPVLAEAAESVGSVQIRNAGTVGGNLCQRPRCWYYRDEGLVCLKKGGGECFSYGGMNKYNAVLGGGPSYIVHPSDLAPALVCLDAEVDLAGPEGSRTLPLRSFFTLPAESDVTRENVLGRGELVRRARIPAAVDGSRSTYLKASERGSHDWALASVALRVRRSGGRIAEAALCLGGVAPVPWRTDAPERLLAGAAPSEELFREVAEAALAGAEPLEHNGYKVPLAKALVVKALRKLAS